MIGDGFCDDATDFAQVKERCVFGAVSKSARCHDDGVLKRESFGDFCREVYLFEGIGHLIKVRIFLFRYGSGNLHLTLVLILFFENRYNNSAKTHETRLPENLNNKNIFSSKNFLIFHSSNVLQTQYVGRPAEYKSQHIPVEG